MLKTVEARLKEIIESNLQNDKLFLVDLKVSVAGSNSKVAVILDGDEGVGIDECAEISRQVGNTIEEEELFTEAYNLEVSSPGLDQPLKLTRQYKKNIGRDVRILLKESSGELLGKLEGVKEEGVEIREQKKGKKNGPVTYENEVKLVPFDEIHKTTILIQF